MLTITILKHEAGLERVTANKSNKLISTVVHMDAVKTAWVKVPNGH